MAAYPGSEQEQANRNPGVGGRGAHEVLNLDDEELLAIDGC